MSTLKRLRQSIRDKAAAVAAAKLRREAYFAALEASLKGRKVSA